MAQSITRSIHLCQTMALECFKRQLSPMPTLVNVMFVPGPWEPSAVK